MIQLSTKKGVFIRLGRSSCPVLTAENMSTRRITYTAVTWCFMCKCTVENVDYFLLHCKSGNTAIVRVQNWFGIQWTMSGTMKKVSHP
uniref:Putative ovule protein n=1 Tax=Solanum chacoense TaxID=4108 RepID=A0A0V0IDR3_SOLCH